MTRVFFLYLQDVNPSVLDIVVKFDHPILLGQGLQPLWMKTLAGCLQLQV